MGADKKSNAGESWFERRAAYYSDRRVKLPLRPSARAAPPSGPRPLIWRLSTKGGAGMVRSVSGR